MMHWKTCFVHVAVENFLKELPTSTNNFYIGRNYFKTLFTFFKQYF